MGSFRFKARAGCEFMLKRVGAEEKKPELAEQYGAHESKTSDCKHAVSNGVLNKLFRSKFRLAHRMACSPEAFVALRHVGMTASGIYACITKSSHFPNNCFVPAAPDVQRDLGQIQAQLGRTGLGNAFLTETGGWMECPQQKFLATKSSGVATSAPCHCRHACGANPTKYKKKQHFAFHTYNVGRLHFSELATAPVVVRNDNFFPLL